jgi:hypothetical protein
LRIGACCIRPKGGLAAQSMSFTVIYDACKSAKRGKI